MTASRDSKGLSIFERLEARGIGPREYTRIKTIVTLDLPQGSLVFQRHFPRRTPAQVLRRVMQWRQTCDRDYLVGEEVKAEIEKSLRLAEFLAWMALKEAAFSGPVGPWVLSQRLVRDANNGHPALVVRNMEVTAANPRMDEKRIAVIQSSSVHESYAKAWSNVFQELGILDLVVALPTGGPFVSARAEQGWPVYTRSLIPDLYEFLLPYYRRRGHVWSAKESALTRTARLPEELLRDMRDILRVEHPGVFDEMNLNQLKAIVSRHLERRTKSKKLRKPSK
jgi:hypothetical protein